MKAVKLTETEARLAELIWKGEPLPSGELVKLCEAELGWKKSTTYTMLKRLEGKGVFINEDGTVFSRISKEDFHADQSKQFVEETFGGSLPRFLAAFTRSRKLEDKEIDELLKLIHEKEEE
ncbi:BlaI/MecI/CopY family transcriptional regulator [Paenibacillus sp. FSL R7-0345]|uniref:BlaI/MecI/CopY family transcriptional regulator n=1 Tax=Paenibacillus sp. FSL R7-0345 TaxID=2954535 RepID=UPI00315AAD15